MNYKEFTWEIVYKNIEHIHEVFNGSHYSNIEKLISDINLKISYIRDNTENIVFYQYNLKFEYEDAKNLMIDTRNTFSIATTINDPMKWIYVRAKKLYINLSLKS